MKKKIIVTMLALTLAAGAVGCSNTKEAPEDNGAAVEASTAEDASAMESTEEAVEEASVEAIAEASKELTDEEREAMHNMLDVTGYIKDNSYENSFFNAKFDLDDSFKFADSSELKELNALDIDFDDEDAVKEAIENEGMVVVAYASDKTDSAPANNIFSVMIEDVGLQGGSIADEKGYLESRKDVIASSLPNSTAEIDTVTFLGEEHYSLYLEANINGTKIYKRYVCRFENKYASLYSIIGRDADTFDEVIKKSEKVR